MLGYLGYRQFIWKPDNEKSKEAYVPALNVIVQEQNNPQSDAKVSSNRSYQKASRSFVKKYDGKIGGEISKYVLATQYMK